MSELQKESVITLSMYLCNNVINVFNQTRCQIKCVTLSQWKDTRFLSSIQNFWHMDSLPGT